MTSGKTPRERQSGPAGEPGSGVASDAAPVSEQPAETPVEQTGSPVESRHANSGATTPRRVTAAAAAAGAAASGSATTEPARTSSPARVESNAAVAAASAAAAAAVAAVSAAIAATAATGATDAAATGAKPAPPTRKKQVAAAAPAAVAPAPAAPETLLPSRPGFVGGKHPELPTHPGLTRFEDLEPPSQPGIAGAGSSEAVPGFGQATEPLFSNEGIVRESSASYRSLFQRVVAVLAAVFAALAAAGTALGHSIGSHLPSGRSAATAAPENLDGASVVDAPPPAPEVASSVAAPDRIGGSAAAGGPASVLLALRAGLALAAGAVAVAAVAVAGAVARPFRKIGGRGATPQLAPVEADEYPPERKRRKAPLFYLAVAGFFVLLYGYLLVGGMILPSMASSTSDPVGGATSTPGVAGGNPTATILAHASASTSATPTVTKPSPTKAPVVIGTPAATPNPTAKPTVKPTAKPTVKPTAKPTPTKAPTPAPTHTPAPTGTPAPPTLAPVNFVRFEPQGTVNGGYTAKYSAVVNTTGLTVIIDSLGGSSCTLSSTATGSKSKTATIPNQNPETGSMIRTPWGTRWAVDPYIVTASCTLAGYATVTATQAVQITAS